MTLGLELVKFHGVAFGDARQNELLVSQLRIGIIGTFNIGPQVAGELDGLSRGLEHGSSVGNAQGHAVTAGILHLAGHGALPDQFVELELPVAELGTQVVGPLELRGRPNRLVGFLGVLDFCAIDPRFVGQVLLAVEPFDLLPRSLHGLIGEGG